MPEIAPQSPCIGVCVLEADGYCRGCYRTIEEIARWRGLLPCEQRTLLRTLAERARERGADLK